MAGRLRSSATGDARVASVDLTCRDAQLPASGRARMADDDIDIAAERGQQAEQALQEGILAEVAPEQPRHVGLGEADHARRALDNDGRARLDDAVDIVTRRRQAPFTEGVKSIGVHFISALGLSNEVGPPQTSEPRATTTLCGACTSAARGVGEESVPGARAATHDPALGEESGE